MMTLKKLLLPAFIPVALLLLFCAWVFYSEATGEVRIYNGKPDNAPARAAVIFAMLSPFFYILFAVLNLIDAALDRLGVKASWIGTASFILLLGFLLSSRALYAPEVDSAPSFTAGLGLSLVIFAPMSFFRRCFIRNPSKLKHVE
jgi:hypothetical protein